ncbi:MAG TPA: hypothetical protein VIT91_09140 [Chthoniobacterales bacterium]
MTPELTPPEIEKMRRDDLRAEYAAVVGYHTALVVGRFTIAALLTGGSAFLAAAALSPDRPTAVKIVCGIFAAWLTLCAWILELRSRSLYRNIAHRCIEIEHEDWQLTGTHWYRGFFSRQYKPEPPKDYTGVPVPKKPLPDAVTVFGRELPDDVALRVTHSSGFDLLYGGLFVFWLLLAAYFACEPLFK